METDGLAGSTIDITGSITATCKPIPWNASGNVTISTTGTGSFGSVSYGSASSYLVNPINATSGLHVSADAVFDGDIKWKGRSLGTLLEKIEDRLAIIQDPDLEKLEKFAALKKAYDNYKLLEKLIGDE